MGEARSAQTGELAYQYVVLRCVPRIDREEFVNVGVALYCEEAKYLDVRWQVDIKRLRALSARLDVDGVTRTLEFYQDLCRGAVKPAETPTRSGDPALGHRFGMLKAPRSTVLQPGPVHGGVTVDPARELDSLLTRLVSH
jgi:Protein of unknown function (DUF3037)